MGSPPRIMNFCVDCVKVLRYYVRPGQAYVIRRYNSNVSPESDRDPAPLFFNQEVQDLLKKVTKVDLKKVFSARKEGEKMKAPKYKFMTDEELEQAMEEARQKAMVKLQIPPFLKERKPIDHVLSHDPALKGFQVSKFVFTDISYGATKRNRLIVVRETNGTLREASWEERDRLNQVYFPLAGRKIIMPKMFEDEHFKKVLDRGEYEFILDRACLQFEPDDPIFIKVYSKTYDAIDEKKKYDILQNTRHYGHMVFYLVWNKRVDDLLLLLITDERVGDAADVVRIYHILHPSAKSSTAKNADDANIVQAFIKEDSVKKNPLQLALNAYLEIEKQRREFTEDIQKAHGHA